MNLQEFLSQAKMSQKKFAELCDVSPATVSFWVSGKMLPLKSHMKIIKKITQGLVDYHDMEGFAKRNLANCVSTKIAAKILKILPISVVCMINKGKLPAVKIARRWYISREEIEKYRKNRYSEDKREFNGEKIWDLQNGEISPNHASKMLNVTRKTIYNLLQRGVLSYRRKGRFFILDVNEVDNLKSNHQQLLMDFAV